MATHAEPAAPDAPSGDVEPLRGFLADHLWEQLGWLIRLRWLAIAGIALVVVLAWWWGMVATEVPLAAVAALLLGANLWFLHWRRRDPRQRELATLERHATVQLLADLGALTALLHWSDGVENPFAMFFAFHAALAAKLLSPRLAFGVVLAAVALQCGTVLGEHLGLIEHHRLVMGLEGHEADEIIESRTFVGAYLVAFVLTQLGTVYFVSTVTRRFHEEWARRARVEQIAASRARLAHVGELSAGVAHSIRNPVHGLLNCVDILRAQTHPTVESGETLAMMEEGLRRVEGLTHRLLALTREAPLQPRRTDLAWIVEDALRFGRAGKSPEIVGFDPDASRSVLADVDPDAVSEALANVLDNAVEACRGGGRVVVRLSTGSPGGMACIEVADTGEGIPAEHVGRVFDPFFTTKAVGEGTGLGLAITRRIVEDHGGSVSIDSDAAGTRVRLFLPAGAEAS